MTQKPIRVLIADDHAIVREGIRAVLSEAGGFEVVAEVGNGQDAVTQTAALHPDVVLMDLLMPVMDGIEASRQITAAVPRGQRGPGILVLTSFAADDQVFPAIKAGALGYLMKDSSPEDLVHAIHQVYLGEPSLHPSIARMVLKEIAHPPEPQPPPDALSARELEVLRLVARGMSNREIADRLIISEPTVRAHMSNILSKLHLASRTQAALYAVREGLASDEAADT